MRLLASYVLLADSMLCRSYLPALISININNAICAVDIFYNKLIKYLIIYHYLISVSYILLVVMHI
jgi:hypothetical protein